MKYINPQDASINHKVNIDTRVTLVSRSRIYTGHCSCGWVGTSRSERHWAVEDWRTHARWQDLRSGIPVHRSWS